MRVKRIDLAYGLSLRETTKTCRGMRIYNKLVVKALSILFGRVDCALVDMGLELLCFELQAVISIA